MLRGLSIDFDLSSSPAQVKDGNKMDGMQMAVAKNRRLPLFLSSGV